MRWHPADAAAVAAALPLALGFFLWAVRRDWRLLRACAAEPDPVAQHTQRLRELLTVFLGQRKLFQEPLPGLMHALIFWGFCVLLLRALTMFGMAFAGFDFHLPGLGPGTLAGELYSLLKDAANVTVALMVLLALWRRYVARVPRLSNTPEAAFILLMILGLMLSDLLFEAARRGGVPAAWGQAGFLFHCLGILLLLAYLPMGKHRHILTSAFNVYLRPLRRAGRLSALDLADEKLDSFGVSRVEELSWKDGLDLLTCTECGRCNEACPARSVGKKLSPRELITAQRDCLIAEVPRLLAGNGDKPKEFTPGVVSPEEFWACTTCSACEAACPVSISHVGRINALRRGEVLMRSRFPAELKRAFKGMETNSNPWGLGAAGRMQWARDLGLPLWSQGQAEYLLYLGCAASFDERAGKAARGLAGLLRKAGVSFAVLGAEEACCGETARRLGEEALGQTLMEHNAARFKELGVRKVLTSCPHCFNTFRNEYPDFGADFTVTHHTQLLRELLRQGKLAPRVPSERVAVHDSCYLGRVNGVYEPVRELLGGRPLEPEKSRGEGFCCGAGGGLFWIEEKGARVNRERVRQLAATGASVIATSCPYCLNMLDSGVKDEGLSGVTVRDVAEILGGEVFNLWRALASLGRWIWVNSLVYVIYERYLWNQIQDRRLPEHIGVILDGNRRWASRLDMPSWGGHKFGADKVDALIGWCLDLKVKTVTLYAFSTENFSRPEPEVAELMRLFDEKLKSIAADERIHRNRVHIRVIGRLNLLPETTQSLARAAEERTKGYDQHYLNIALAYGGRAEIVDAAKRIAQEAKDGSIQVSEISEKMIAERLYTSHLPKQEPDLIIRTSGEERTSGFLLWQGAYSELSFSDVFWPDFRRIDLWRAIRTYQRRERRYGN